MIWFLRKIRFTLLFLLLIQSAVANRTLLCRAYGGDETSSWPRKVWAWSGHAAFYAGSYVPLYATWYKPYGSSSFHFFDDGAEWRSTDKFGHTFTAFQLSSLSTAAFQWAYPMDEYRYKSIWLGTGFAMLYQTTLEVFDGFSSGWGFSWGDMAANTSGALLFALHKRFAERIFIRPKFSSHSTSYALYRPEVLGSSKAERTLKDYNGQTYWLSIGIPTFQYRDKWWTCLNLSVGVNSYGMTGGRFNPSVNDKGESIPAFERNTRGLISFDVDWERIPTDKKWLKTCFRILNLVKLPFPALEIGKNTQLHGWYF